MLEFIAVLSISLLIITILSVFGGALYKTGYKEGAERILFAPKPELGVDAYIHVAYGRYDATNDTVTYFTTAANSEPYNTYDLLGTYTGDKPVAPENPKCYNWIRISDLQGPVGEVSKSDNEETETKGEED